MKQYNSEQLKALHLTQLAQDLNIKKAPSGLFECFGAAHKNQEKRASLSMADGKGFYCHKSCGIKGSEAIALAKQYYNCEFLEACEKLSQMYNIPLSEGEINQLKSPKYKELLKYENFLEYSEIFSKQESVAARRAKKELEGRGISFEEAQKYNVAVIENLFISQIKQYNDQNKTDTKTNYDVIAFPMYNSKFEYTGLKYRLFADDYKQIPKEIGLAKSMTLSGSKTGLLFIPENIKEAPEVLCCEGEIDGLSLGSLGFENIIINLGGVGNCMELIKFSCIDKKVISLYDNDKAGKKANVRFSEILKRPIHTVELPCAEGKEKTDINDKIQEGWKKEHFEEAIQNAKLLEMEKSANDEIKRYERNDVVIEKHLFCYKKIQTHKGNNGEWNTKEIILSDFALKISENYIVDGEIIRQIQIKGIDKVSQPFLMTPKEITSVQDFETIVASKGNFSFFGTKQDMKYIFALEFESVPDRQIIQPKHIGFLKNENVWMFGNTAWHKGKIIEPDEESVFWINKKKGYKPMSLVVGDANEVVSGLPILNVLDEKKSIELQEKVCTALYNNIGYYAWLTMGWVKAIIYSQEIFKEHKYFPILFPYGKYQSGKSMLASWVMEFFGLSYDSGLSIEETTQTAISRSLDYYCSFPVWLDEYRNTQKTIKMGGFFRNIYNRLGAKKALRNQFGTREPRVNGCLIISGEELPNDSALRSRLLPIRLSEKTRNNEAFQEVNRLIPSFNSLVAYWIQTKTKETTEQMLKDIKIIRSELIKAGADTRSAEVYSVAISSFATIKPDADFMQWAEKEALTDYQRRETENIVNIFWQYLEFFISENKYIKGDYFRLHEDKIYIWFAGTYKQIQKSHRQVEGEKLPPKNVILDHFREESYFLEANKNFRLNNIARACLVLDSSKLPEEISKNLLLDDSENIDSS
ncbi:hypothetical protein HON22_03940 [Candidatus Peregrinibacteria bacterium]|jgi:5S rRNA maturation endonuclease (ribonuclease M5)|nr:hypothetical protein [Candidatus Peregrinibacteria bacterium]